MAKLDDRQAAAYLELLGVDVRPGEVDAETLARLQRAHVDTVPYETIDIVRGRPPAIEPLGCVQRVLGGRGGYCYHLNGSFATLLEWLVVDLTRHVSGVWGQSSTTPPGPNGNHLGLTVALDGGRWLVDVGLGDGPIEPLPFRWGSHEQDGRVFGLGPSPLAPGGWRLDHDPTGSFTLVDFAAAPAVTNDFAAMHRHLSTSLESRFSHVATAQRHTPGGFEVLRGCVFTETGATTVVDAADDWWSLVIDRFGLAYGSLDASERDSLWQHVRATHQEWLATQA